MFFWFFFAVSAGLRCNLRTNCSVSWHWNSTRRKIIVGVFKILWRPEKLESLPADQRDSVHAYRRYAFLTRLVACYLFLEQEVQGIISHLRQCLLDINKLKVKPQPLAIPASLISSIIRRISRVPGVQLFAAISLFLRFICFSLTVSKAPLRPPVSLQLIIIIVCNSTQTQTHVRTMREICAFLNVALAG